MGSVSGRDSAVCCRCIVLSSFIFHILHLTFTLVFQHTMTCIWYYEKYTTKWHESELADDSKRVQYNMIQSTKYESDSGLVWSSTPLLLWEPKLYQLLLNPKACHTSLQPSVKYVTATEVFNSKRSTRATTLSTSK